MAKFDTEEIAKLLDDKGRYKRSSVEVNKVETDKIVSNLCEKIDMLVDVVNKQAESMAKRDQEVEELRLQLQRAEIARVSAVSDNVTLQRKGNRNEGFYRCEKCGLPYHKRRDCRGTNLSCFLCKKKGHTQYATDFHSEKN